MRIGLFVNDIRTEKSDYTTTRLALAAVHRGHEVWHIGASDFAYDPDDRVSARARAAPRRRYKSTESYLAELQGEKARQERISVDDLDVLFLRSDPAQDAIRRPWAQNIGILFGQVAVRRGVIVVNDPDTLAAALTKIYFQSFPEEVRPRTLITRDREEIKAFASSSGTIVVKPFQGSGGANVFLVRPEDLPNLNQMIDSVVRDGYAMAQEYLPAAEEGDLRLLMMNGLPLRHRGKHAALRRLRAGGDMRSNMHAGGQRAPARIDDKVLQVAEIVRPKLVADGLFFVGLDIVGDKVMEINIFSPGGLYGAELLEGVSFSCAVIEALERKVEYVRHYNRRFDNVEMATL